MVEVNGTLYNTRPLNYGLVIPVTVSTQITQQFTFPGRADYMLKSITRATIAGGVDVTAAKRFLVAWQNSDNQLWYQASGVGQTSNLIVDSTIFGTPSFPKPLGDGIFFGRSSSISFTIQDLSTVLNYTIYLTLDGEEILSPVKVD